MTRVHAWRWLAPLGVAAAVWLLPARRVRSASMGAAVSLRRRGVRADYRPMPSGAVMVIAIDRGHASGPLHASRTRCPGYAQRHRLADRRRVPVLARRSSRHGSASASPTHIVEPPGRKPAPARLLHRPGRSRHGADDAVEYGARRRHAVSHHPERRAGVRLGARPDGLADRRVPDDDALSGRSRRVGDVPHGGGAEPAGRGARAPGIGNDAVVDDLGAGGLGAGRGRAAGGAVRRLSPVPAGAPRHDGGAVAGRRAPAGHGAADAARAGDARRSSRSCCCSG